MNPKFNNEQLDLLPIDNVLSALGVEFNGKDFFCPYDHKKPQRLKVYHTNSVHCHNCHEITGSPINVTKLVLGVEYKEAAIWLHEQFNVPYLDGDAPERARPLPKLRKKEIEYMEFDPFKACNTVKISDFMKKYTDMQEFQRLKMVYTTLYRYSLNTEQAEKYAYYKKERGIPSNNTYIQKIGYLSQEDIKDAISLLQKHFPEKDLLEFGVLKEKNGKVSFAFDYIKEGGILVVPSMDLYTDMVTGFMMRPTHPAQWMKERGLKELQLSKSHILKPLPFGLTCEALKSHNEFYLTEGHPDLASIPGNINGDIERAGIASPGTYGFRAEMLSLLRGKRIILMYDQDFSGRKAVEGYHTLTYESTETKTVEFLDTKEGKKKLKEKFSRLSEDSKPHVKFHMGMKQKLRLAGVKDVEVLTWNRAWGGDLNDVRIQGNLSLLFPPKDKS